MTHTETKHDNPTLDRAGDDEPIFVLRGMDALACSTIESWIVRAQQVGASYAKLSAVLDHMQLMKQWQEENGCKLPD